MFDETALLHKENAPVPKKLLAGIIASVVIMAILFAYTSISSQNNNRYRALAGDLRLLSLEMVNHAVQATQSKPDDFGALSAARDRYVATLEQLRSGDASTGLPAGAGLAQNEFDQLAAAFTQYNQHVDTILRSEGLIRLLNEFATSLNKVMPDILEISENVNKSMLSSDLRADTKHLASRQLLLGQRIATDVNRLMQVGRNSNQIIQSFRRDTDEFYRVLQAFLNSDAKSGIPAVSHRRTRDYLMEIQPKFDTVRELVARISEKTPELIRSQDAAHEMLLLEPILSLRASDLANAYANRDSLFSYLRVAAFVVGGVVILLLLVLSTRINRVTEHQLRQEQSRNQHNQEAILRLLDEISPVADGDLTTKITVSEDITGAIADAINYTIEALRSLVISINKMTAEVAITADETQATATLLTRASEKQVTQIAEITKTVSIMAKGTHALSQQAQESVGLAQKAAHVAEEGVVAVHNSIDAMHTLRNDIRDTAIRVKRLGESSQAIGDVVVMINEIAEQTNILAINAAIQAAAAGAQGYGFATIANEVQQLAETVSLATQKIESLVKSIQTETADAVSSMEQSTTDTQEAAQLAEGAGEALIKMETTTEHLAKFNRQVAQAAHELTQTAEQIAINMELINNLTAQNLSGAKQTAKLTAQLAEAAEGQKSVVAKFRLPTDAKQA